ncbi:MAG: geranylgeranylglyceryl/heptaprenylglyceryl phosphate synthase [Flavobacteriaceae bacterium]
MTKSFYKSFSEALFLDKKLLAILIDPEKFDLESAASFLRKLPIETSHLFVGGSTVPNEMTKALVKELKLYTAKPILLFPGDVSQITSNADGLLFLSLLSGRNPEYLIGQQVKAVSKLRGSSLEVIPTGYILIDGENESAVERVTQTKPLPQDNIQTIVDTAKAGELMGAKLIYLEAGSGAKKPVSVKIISAVKKELNIPLIVGGGIKTKEQITNTYQAGATMIVMGTAFEK